MTSHVSHPRNVTLCVACLGILLSVVGCKQKPAAPAQQAPTVTVTQPVQESVNLYYEFTGTTAAVEEVDIRARVEGFLKKIHFNPSQLVEAGDLLYEIEPDTYQIQVQKAEANMAAAQADELRANADFERMQKAAETDAVSKQQVDTYRAQYQVAKAAVKQAEAALAEAKLRLDYTRVTSPIRGRVNRSLVDTGNLVGAGERTLLTTVVTMNPVYVYFNVDERLLTSRLARLHDREELHGTFESAPHIPCFLGLEGEKGYPHDGEIDFVNNKVDPGTGTLQIRGRFPNDDGLIYPGVFARIRIPDDLAENAILVEEAAIGTDMAGKYLLVVGANNMVERRGISLGALMDDQRRVVLDGVTAEDTYIVKGLLRARPGMPVTPQSLAAQTPEGDADVQ